MWWKLERIPAFDKTKLYWNCLIDFGDACGLNGSRKMKGMIDNMRRGWQILAAIYHTNDHHH